MSVAKVATTHIEHADARTLPNAKRGMAGEMVRAVNLTPQDRGAFATSVENRRPQS